MNFRRKQSATPLAPDQPRLTPVFRKPGFDFSMTGLVYCTTMLLMGVAAINGQANLLFGIFGLMIGVLLVSGVICRMVLRRLSVTRVLPEYVVAGRPATILYQFKNNKRFWPSLSVTFSETEGTEAFQTQTRAYLLHAAPQRTASVPAEIIPKRRGAHQLGAYQLSTSFPFGFIKRAIVKRERDTVLVCPAIGRVSKQLLGMCRSDQRADATVKPSPGGQDEFYGVKEHRPGDNPRWIYWRRSARAPGVLVSREMTQVAPPKLMILADTFSQPAATIAERAAVEKALAMAATLASQALDEGLAVGLCAWDGSDWAVLPTLQGKQHRRDLLGLLARLPVNHAVDASALMNAASGWIKGGTTAVLFTPQPVAVSLGDRLRSSLLVVPALSMSAQTWFSFDKEVDFVQCVPLETYSPTETKRPRAKLEPLWATN